MKYYYFTNRWLPGGEKLRMLSIYIKKGTGLLLSKQTGMWPRIEWFTN